MTRRLREGLNLILPTYSVSVVLESIEGIGRNSSFCIRKSQALHYKTKVIRRVPFRKHEICSLRIEKQASLGIIHLPRSWRNQNSKSKFRNFVKSRGILPRGCHKRQIDNGLGFMIYIRLRSTCLKYPLEVDITTCEQECDLGCLLG